jgi:ATP-dependent RNA helicase RhlE
MNSFRRGRVKVLVATDIAARGIDVSQVSHVINYDIPDTADAYTHRTGRTGRMEHLGTALTLVTKEDLPMVRTIERLMGQNLERRQVINFDESIKIPSQPVETYSKKVQPRTNNNRFRTFSRSN